MGTLSTKRLYEIDAANRSLPLVRSIVRDVIEEFQTLRAAGREQRALESGIDGDTAKFARLSRLRSFVTESSTRVEGYLNELDDLGVELRDLETGLVDFPTIMHGELAYLCWRPGEQEVRFWHAATQGFADRRPIPERTMAILSGDASA